MRTKQFQLVLLLVQAFSVLSYRNSLQTVMGMSESVPSLLQIGTSASSSASPVKPLFNLQKKLNKPAALSFDNPKGHFDIGLLGNLTFDIQFNQNKIYTFDPNSLNGTGETVLKFKTLKLTNLDLNTMTSSTGAKTSFIRQDQFFNTSSFQNGWNSNQFTQCYGEVVLLRANANPSLIRTFQFNDLKFSRGRLVFQFQVMAFGLWTGEGMFIKVNNAIMWTSAMNTQSISGALTALKSKCSATVGGTPEDVILQSLEIWWTAPSGASEVVVEVGSFFSMSELQSATFGIKKINVLAIE